MKKDTFIDLLLLMVFLLAAFISNAQVKINSAGQMIVGNDTVDTHYMNYLAPNLRDTITSVKIIGWNGKYGQRARLSFGDQAKRYAYGVLVGEYTDDDTDQLWLHGKLGMYGTYSANRDSVLFAFDPVRYGRYFNFAFGVQTNQVLVSSDARFKEDVQPVDDALATLSEVAGVSYKYKDRGRAVTSRFNQKTDEGDEESLVIDEKDQRDKELMARIEEIMADDSRHYGFVAQDLEAVLPDLVYTDKQGYKSVDYIGLIPILVNAINELSQQVAELREEKDAPAVMNAPMQEDPATAAEDIAADMVVPRLFQNQPNPFSTETQIRYQLPETVAKATLYIYDMQGKQIKAVDVAERGMSSVTIGGGDLAAGMYFYSLIADGQEVDTKRMILTK